MPSAPDNQAGLAAPIALFGGSFDPVHRGHIQVACEVQRQLGVDDFRLVPAGDPPHRSTTFASAGQRLAMLQLAVEGYPQLHIDCQEIERSGPSWTVDTLEACARRHPRSPLLLVVGQDAVNTFDQWHRWREILVLAHLVVVTRPGEEPAYTASLRPEMSARTVHSVRLLRRQLGGLVLPVVVSPLDISSTLVRECIAAGRPVDAYLAPAVADYVRQHGLYGATGVL